MVGIVLGADVCHRKCSILQIYRHVFLHDSQLLLVLEYVSYCQLVDDPSSKSQFQMTHQKYQRLSPPIPICSPFQLISGIQTQQTHNSSPKKEPLHEFNPPPTFATTAAERPPRPLGGKALQRRRRGDLAECKGRPQAS